MKIAIIDDEPDICFILSFELNSLGHETVIFNNATEAKEFFTHNTADSVICDFQMPHINGYQFFEWLKSRNILIPFYILTGEPTMDIKFLLNNGIKEVLFKPHDLIKIHALFK